MQKRQCYVLFLTLLYHLSQKKRASVLISSRHHLSFILVNLLKLVPVEHLQVKITLATSSSLTMEPDGTFLEAEECKIVPASEIRSRALELMNKII